MEFSDNQLKIAELQDEPNIVIPIGQYTVDINLEDNGTPSQGTTTYQITLDMQEAPNQLPYWSLVAKELELEQEI